MAVRLNTAARNGILDSGANHFNGGTLKIFTGTQPATGGGSHSDTELASGTISSPAFAAASSGSVSPNATWTASIGANGTAGWARLEASAGGAMIDFAVGLGSGDLSLDDTSLTSGGVVNVTGGTITLPAS